MAVIAAARSTQHRLSGRNLLLPTFAIAAVCAARMAGWLDGVSLAFLVAAIVGAAVVSEVVAVFLPAGGSRMALHLRIAAQVAGVSVAIYATGWGPVLAAGYLYIAVDAFRKHGSRAKTPLLVWVSAAIVGGQVAIATGAAPTSLPVPAVHGVALLVFFAVLTSVEFLGTVTRGKEREERRTRILLRHSADAVVVVGRDGAVRYASPGASRVIGGVHIDAVGRPMADLVHPDDRHLAREVLRRVMTRPGEPVRGEVRMVGPDAGVYRVEFTATNLLGDETVDGIVVNARDASDRTPAADVGDASRDHLTGLADRAFFVGRIRAAARRTGVTAQRFAVVVVDMDHFDLVNATVGAPAGDRVLRQVADRLRACVRPDDLVARLGDDEFALLVGSVLGPDDVMTVGSRVVKSLAEPYLLGDREHVLSASVGISLCQSGVDASLVLQQAQLAVRAAKRRGGRRCELFDANLAAPARRRLDLQADLARAVDRREFVLHYQPVVNLADDGVIGFEALVRWQHPRQGLIPPADFIPLAEQSGLIDELGQWVLHQACRDAGGWRACGRGQDIHVNLSARQLANPHLATRVGAALRSGSLEASRLVLEITETAVMEDVDASVAAMHRVREAGVRFAIDDFGIGYSSFAYLNRLPADILKLDRSLISGVDEDDAVVDTVVALAHRRGMTAVAEGVERGDQAERLRRIGCDQSQGFWFGRPVAAVEAAKLIG